MSAYQSCSYGGWQESNFRKRISSFNPFSNDSTNGNQVKNGAQSVRRVLRVIIVYTLTLLSFWFKISAAFWNWLEGAMKKSQTIQYAVFFYLFVLVSRILINRVVALFK